MKRAASLPPAIAVQMGLIVAGWATLGLMPPAQGVMLVLPLAPASGPGLPARAVAAGALIAGRGPFAGSLLLRGRRAALIGPMLAAGALPIAAPWGSCGQRPEDR